MNELDQKGRSKSPGLKAPMYRSLLSFNLLVFGVVWSVLVVAFAGSVVMKAIAGVVLALSVLFAAFYLSMNSYRGMASSPPSQHRYAAMLNNPVIYTDPSGPIQSTRIRVLRRRSVVRSCARASCGSCGQFRNASAK
jgi:hypothetical protein